MSISSSSSIQEGHNVLFRRDKTSRVFKIRKNRQIFFEKAKFNAEALIGEVYGTTFEIDRGKLIKVEKDKDVELPAAAEAATAAGADNRNLQDLDSNQKLSKDDILKLKGEGATGEKIIEKLIENSETFKDKTEFSKAKFIKKKKKKYLSVFTALRPTPRLVMDMFIKEPGKICFLRPDSLSQLLSYSNVMYGSRVAVAESCQGLVVACVLQRLGGSGRLINLVPSNGAFCRNVLEYFSFPKEHLDLVYNFPLDNLSEPEKSSIISKPVPESDSTGIAEKDLQQNSDLSSDNVVDSRPSEVEQNNDVNLEPNNDKESIIEEDQISNESKSLVNNRELHKQAKALRLKEAAETLISKDLDSLIIACKYNPVPVLKKMLKLMTASKPVVVYCPYIDPLKDCYTYIKEEKLGIQVRLTETWFREYQVLPQRTHPMMNMSGTGGYLLTFMTLDPSQPNVS